MSEGSEERQDLWAASFVHAADAVTAANAGYLKHLMTLSVSLIVVFFSLVEVLLRNVRMMWLTAVVIVAHMLSVGFALWALNTLTVVLDKAYFMSLAIETRFVATGAELIELEQTKKLRKAENTVTRLINVSSIFFGLGILGIVVFSLANLLWSY